MKRILLMTTTLISIACANEAAEVFNTKCAVCHKVNIEDKNSLIAPPIDKVMMHVKKSFDNKKDAIVFMKDYVMSPDPKKTICPSIDIFGVMPSQKDTIKDEELEKVVNYLYDNFPQQNRQKGMHKGKGMGRGGFMKIDINSDGSISKDEFKAFRAKKEGIDVTKIKYDYFFNKLDKNSDGKLSKDEFMAFKKMMKGH